MKIQKQFVLDNYLPLELRIILVLHYFDFYDFLFTSSQLEHPNLFRKKKSRAVMGVCNVWQALDLMSG